MSDPRDAPPASAFSDLLAQAVRPPSFTLANLVAPEVVDGWRAQLLTGHEQALQGVAGSVSRAIADLNLAGLAAAAVPQTLVGEELQRAISELAATYTTGIGAQVRDLVISGIRPAALAASAAMMERLRASSEVQRTYDEALRRMGWWLPPSVSMSFFWEVGRLADERKRVALRWAMADYAKSREFGRSVEGWMDLDVFKDRRRFIRDGLKDHRNGRYRVSIPTLLPHIEGIAIAAFGPTNRGGPRDLITRVSTIYDPIMGQAMVEAVGVLWENRAFEDYSPRALNRHFILHGRSTGYATEENSVKVLFALDLLASVIQEARRHPERATQAP
jgi:hypothetical protein